LIVVYRLGFETPRGLNPFEDDDRQERKAYVREQRERENVIKNAFSSKKIPQNLDAIVIGGGIGGLTAAAILSKAGKKVSLEATFPITSFGLGLGSRATRSSWWQFAHFPQ